MDIAEFDRWRADYDRMSYAEQQSFYDRMEAEHPVQAGYALDNGLLRFTHAFEQIIPKLPKTYVLELGGWHGELAKEMLSRCPGISVWCNVEISRAAVRNSVFSDARYLTYVPPDQPWRVPLPPGNVLVASHFIEHIRADNLVSLMLSLPDTLRYMILVAPLPESAEDNDWAGYHGSHILEWGWREVRQQALFDWKLIDELSHKDFKVFRCLM